MRKTLTTVALLLALSCTAFGGEMSTPPAPASQPQPTPTRTGAVQEPTTTDEDTTGAAETLTQVALNLVSSVLSLL